MLERAGSTLLVGAPGDATGGTVSWLTFHSAGSLTARGLVSQDSPSVPGSSESGDRFARRWPSTPRQAADGSWSVRPGSRSDRPATTGARAFDRDSAGVVGTAEAGDRFGTALAVPAVPAGAGPHGYADDLIGVPGDGLDTGWVLKGLPGRSATHRVYTAATRTDGARFGAALG